MSTQIRTNKIPIIDDEIILMINENLAKSLKNLENLKGCSKEMEPHRLKAIERIKYSLFQLNKGEK